MKIRFKRLRSDVPLPEYKTAGSVAFDLALCEDATVNPGEIQLLPTGLVVCTPPGYMLMVVSRSSTSTRYGLQLSNSVGIIDQDYCGPQDEIKLQVRNFTDKPVTVPKGIRIAQAIFVKVEKAELEEGELENTSRGGFGSTGH